MAIATGTVASMARNGKAFTLDTDPTLWFSVFKPEQAEGVARGAVVEFNYKAVSKPGGAVFNNIQGNVRVINPGDTPVSNVTSMAAGRPAATFGNVELSRDRCIVRQNAMNVAAQLLQSLNMDKVTPEDATAIAITMAKAIEDYTSGDIDRKEAEEALKNRKSPSIDELLDEAS